MTDWRAVSRSSAVWGLPLFRPFHAGLADLLRVDLQCIEGGEDCLLQRDEFLVLRCADDAVGHTTNVGRICRFPSATALLRSLGRTSSPVAAGMRGFSGAGRGRGSPCFLSGAPAHISCG